MTREHFENAERERKTVGGNTITRVGYEKRPWDELDTGMDKEMGRTE